MVSWFAEVQLPSGLLGSLQFTPEGNPTGDEGRWAADGQRSQGGPPKPTGDIAGVQGGAGLGAPCAWVPNLASDAFLGSRFTLDFNQVPLPYSPFGTR